MTALPWSKFFWDDWESDEALKMCSPGAQALWMRMLCICAKADGYLAIAGRKLDVEDMAKLTGWALIDVQAWWEELKRWGVFSAEGRGRIYCRRMVKDARKAAIARANGKNGGNPALGNNKRNPPSDNQNATEVPTNGPSISQKPEARDQKVVLEFPEPQQKTQSQQNGQAVQRGSRLPADWRPGTAEIEFALGEGFTLAEVRRIGEDYRDYWVSKAGRDAAHLDWLATWRRWVRKHREPRGKSTPPKRVSFV